MMKDIFRLFLMVLVLAVAAGCSKKMSEEERSKIFGEGMAAYAGQDFATALTKFKTVAEKGDMLAQFNVGVMYHEGKGVSQDDKEAISWWEKAAEQGHGEAADNIGLRFGKGQGVGQDWVQAYKWFSISAATGNQTARNNMQVAATRMTPAQIQQAETLAKQWQDKHKK